MRIFLINRKINHPNIAESKNIKRGIKIYKKIKEKGIRELKWERTWNKSGARHLNGEQRARIKLPRRRRLLFVNYLPSCDLRRESSLTVYVNLDGGWYRKIGKTCKKELKAIWGAETRGEEKIRRSRRKDASNWQPRKPSPSDCSLLWRVSKFTLSLSTSFFYFTS